MKAINIKLASFTFAALLLASCSDSTDGPSGNVEKNIVGKEVTSITDAQELASRVINFNQSSASKARSRAADVESVGKVLEMPNVSKEIPASAQEYPQDNNVKPNTVLYLDNFNGGGITLGKGCTLYIKGNVTLDNYWGTWSPDGGETPKVVILEGATLTWKGSNIFNNPNDGIDIINYGTFQTLANSYEFGTNTSFYNEGTLICTDKEISAQKNFYTNKPVVAKNFTINQGANVTIKGNLEIKDKEFKTTGACNVYIGGNLVTKDFKTNSGNYINVLGDLELPNKDIDIQGTVNFGGHVTTNQLSVTGDGNLYACSIDCSNFLINSNNARVHTNYLHTKKMYQCAGSIIYLVDNSVIDCEGEYENQNNGVGTILLDGGNNAKALFKANRIKFNGSNDFQLDENDPSSKFSTCYIFNANGDNSWIYVDVNEIENNNTTLKGAEELAKAQWGGRNQKWGDVAVKSLDDATCGYKINIPEDKGKELIPEADITYDHKHDISATCVQPYNGKMYMSYHTRGVDHGACIEVFETKNGKTTMLQYLQDKKEVLDFNHLMIDTKSSTPQLYVVGSSNDSGAMLARIDINNDGLLNTDVREIDENTSINPLTVVPLIRNVQKGSAEAQNDENCIVRDGDKLLVMSTRGYEVYDPETLNSLGSKTQPGKAKHITMNGTEMATLYYTSRPNSVDAEVAGKVELFNTGADILNATPSKTIDIEGIAPNNGKNTIAIDGNYIYVCRSGKGLSCYDKNSGAEVWNWSAPLTANTKVPQGYANGVTFDSNYIYLACGGYGLVVLDKNNKTAEGKPAVVAKARCSTKNSANYVTLNNGYIYVAYGKSRMQVFKLVDKGTSSSSTDYTKK